MECIIVKNYSSRPGTVSFQLARLLSRRDLECLLFGLGISCTSLPIGPFAVLYAVYRQHQIIFNFIIIRGSFVFVNKFHCESKNGNPQFLHFFTSGFTSFFILKNRKTFSAAVLFIPFTRVSSSTVAFRISSSERKACHSAFLRCGPIPAI